MRLQGKVAVVTGGTSGLGLDIASQFATEGATVVCASRSAKIKHPDSAALDTRRLSVEPVDVRDYEAVGDLFARTVDAFGALDIVVTSAGEFHRGAAERLSLDEWQEMILTFVSGTFHCIRAALPIMRAAGHGRIITISSAAAQWPMLGTAGYAACKGAVEALTRTTANEAARHGIAVNCIAPGIIDSGRGADVIADQRVWPRYAPRLAAGRPGTGLEIARTAVFLASDEASYINAAIVEVNGGLFLG